MNIKVMIVEDEPMIRKGIATVLPWKELGCEVIALASNGQEGLEKSEEEAPQLIISDIRMPIMDGLEMIEKISGKLPDTQVILLSGYKEFEYAQRAIAYGVSEYILKPVNQKELIEAVKRSVQVLRDKEKELKEKELLAARVRESLPILRDRFIQQMLFSGIDSTYHVAEKMEYFQISISRFAIIMAEIDSFHELESSFTEDDIQILLFMITEQMEDLQDCYRLKIIPFQHGNAVYAIVSVTGTTTMENLLEYGHALTEQVNEKGKFHISVGISSIYEGAEGVRKARGEAEKCVKQGYYLGTGSVVCTDDLILPVPSSGIAEIETEPFFEAVRQGNNITEKAAELVSALDSGTNIMTVKMVSTEVITKGLRILMEEFGEDKILSEYLDKAMERLFCARQIYNYTDILTEAGEWIENYLEERQSSRTGYLMDQAIAFMKENCSRDLSLEEVAEHVYVSKWYFSKLFRKEQGEKFSDYFSRLRMEQAAKIIRENPSLKNYEVAEQLGFNDVRYFSQLFKKRIGKTPSEYRNQT